jgi:N-acetylmuramoyl-L-alanine amidase
VSRKSFSMLLFVIIIALTAISPVQAAAKESSFELNTTPAERSFNLTVKGLDLADLYAYDMLLNYDQTYLRLVSAKSDINGFAVDPIIESNSIRLAHTKIGNVKGVNGAANLATFTFERIREGDTAITLEEVQLVDSKLELVVLQPKLEVTIDNTFLLPKFKDIAGHWAEDNIIEAVSLGFINGYTDHTFRPNELVDRAAFTAMLARALHLKSEAELAFTDAKQIPAWALAHVKAAIAANIISGYSDNTFRAERQITRSEMAAMIVRAADLKPSNEKTSFGDSGQIAAWAEPYIAAAVDAGLMQGRGGNKFAPNEFASRAEAVTLILNLLNKLAAN